MSLTKNGDFVYLKDIHVCPKCRCRWGANHSKNCHNCGVKLFIQGPPQDAAAMELETGLRDWWAYDRFRGWVYRDHWMVEGAKPLIRHYEPPKISSNYGRSTTPEQVAAGKARSKRFKGREKTKIKAMSQKVYV